MIAGPARAVAVLCAVFLVFLVRAQDGAATNIGSTSGAPPALASPRAAVGTFLHGINDADIARATQALDLSEVGPLERVDRGSQLAFKLWAILNRETYIEVDSLSNATNAPPYVLPITASGGRIGKITLAKGEDGAYRFSSDTLENLDVLWPLVRSKPVVAGLPDPGLEKLNPSGWLEGRMPADSRQSLLGVAAWKWVVLAVLALAGALGCLAIRGLTYFVARKVLKLEKSSHEYQDLMQGGLGVALAVVGSLFARDVLFLESPGAWGGIVVFGARMAVVFGLVLLAFAAWDCSLRAYVRRAEARSHHSKRVIAPVMLRLGRAVIVVLAFLGVAQALGFRPSNVVATLGISGLIVAFAAKDSIENVFGSIVVLVENPFTIGDWVKIGEVSGEVEDIRLRSTRIRTFDDSVVIFPNSMLLTKGVENFGMRRYRRLRTTIEVAADTPPERVEKFVEGVRKLVEEHPMVNEDRRSVRLNELGPRSLRLLLDCYLVAPDSASELSIREELLLGAVRIAHELDVRLACASGEVTPPA